MTKFGVICCDPPWSFDDRLARMKKPVKRSAVSHYDVMSPAEIASLDVKSLADPKGCLLALWVPGSMLVQGLNVVEAWGFKHKQTFVWVKLQKEHKKKQDWNDATRVGMGRLFRQSHEIALICTSGKSVYASLEDHSQRSVAFDLNIGHSTKPPTLQQRLEKMFPAVNKVELFARRPRAGWVCVGDAVSGKDIRESIQELNSDVESLEPGEQT